MLDRRPPLPPLAREAECGLQRGVGLGEALHPDAEPGVVHHREHRRHALMRRADQPALGALVFHHAGRAAVQAHLVLERQRPHRVLHAWAAVGVGQEFGHQEERDPPGARGAVRQPGQDQVTDVVGDVVVAPGDEDLLAADRVGAVVRGSARVRTAPTSDPACGSVMFIVPVQLPGDELGQEDGLDRLRRVMLQRLDLPLGQQRARARAPCSAAEHISPTQVSRITGSPMPPCAGSAAIPTQPPAASAR